MKTTKMIVLMLVILTMLIACETKSDDKGINNQIEESDTEETAATTDEKEKYYPLSGIDFDKKAKYSIYKYTEEKEDNIIKVTLELCDNNKAIKNNADVFTSSHMNFIDYEKRNMEFYLYKNNDFLFYFWANNEDINYGTLEFRRVNPVWFISGYYNRKKYIVHHNYSVLLDTKEIGDYMIVVHGRSNKKKNKDHAYILGYTTDFYSMKIKEGSKTISIGFNNSKTGVWEDYSYDIAKNKVKRITK